MIIGGYNTSTVIREILTVLYPVMPKHMGTSGSKINNNGVSTLKLVGSKRYSVVLMLGSRRSNIHRIEALFSFDRTSQKCIVNGLGRYPSETVYF